MDLAFAHKSLVAGASRIGCAITSRSTEKKEQWWRIPEEFRPEALDDAVRLAVSDQESTGLSFVTTGRRVAKRLTVLWPRVAVYVSMSITGEMVDEAVVRAARRTLLRSR